VLLEAASSPPPASEAVAPAPLTTDRQREAALSTTAPAPAPASAAPDQPGAAASAPSIPVTAVGDEAGGVRVAGIRQDDTDFQSVYDPGHPDADETGYVKMPNVNMINEMVDMMMAARAYEANLSALNTSRDMLLRTLTIGKQ
jgi:flagellar basal-body rod protein FlgC